MEADVLTTSAGVNTRNKPWAWIPTVYIAEGLPNCVVITLSVLIYTKLGVGKAEMAFYTGWLYLPWVIKPFWSPFIDILRTKRWWTVTMELAMALTMASVAFFMPTSMFFAATMAMFWLTAFFSATHDIAADGYYMLALTDHQQAVFAGVRNTFYRVGLILGQGGLVIVAGMLEAHGMEVAWSWTVVFIIISLLFLGIGLWNSVQMPRLADDHPDRGTRAGSIGREFVHTFASFFTKPHIITAVCFMMLYRFPEAMCIKLVQPFMIAPLSEGGLAMSTASVGIANGTVGVVGLLAGGILGGLAIARNGLKNWLWPMAMALTLPCALYLLLALTQPASLFWVCLAVFVEQFGYGFGYAALMLYLIYFSSGENKTSYFAFCSGITYLGMMLPGMVAGWLFEKLGDLQILAATGPQGYVNFFLLIVLCSLVTFSVCMFVKIDPHFGRKDS